MALTTIEADRGHYFHLTLVGSGDYQAGEFMHSSLIGLIRKHPGTRFLIDITALKGRPDVFQSIQIAEAMPKETLKQIPRIAILDLTTNHSYDTVAESLMVNRGLDVKFFFEEAEAVSWLLE